MQTVMLQFVHHGTPPAIDEVRRMFDLAAEEIDPQFGVIPIDPAQGIYTVLIDFKACPRVEAALARRTPDPTEGIFANPRIEPTDPSGEQPY